MEDEQMGFYLMVASMLLGLLALKIGFSQFKEKKDKFFQIEDKRHFWHLSFLLFKNILSYHLLIYPKI